MNLGMHHLHIRERRNSKKDAYPHPNKSIRAYDYFMYVVGSLSFLALYPQVQHVYMSHSVEGLSLITWSVLGMINILWLIYAIIHKQTPIALANIGMGAMNFAVVLAILMFQ